MFESALAICTAEGFPDAYADVLRQIVRIEAMRCDDGASDTPGPDAE